MAQATLTIPKPQTEMPILPADKWKENILVLKNNPIYDD